MITIKDVGRFAIPNAAASSVVVRSGLYDAVFSLDDVYRYELRAYGPKPVTQPRRFVCWIMLNPSTADQNQLDPTLTRCFDFTSAWGFDGMIVVNLFALRSTDPRGLWEFRRPCGPWNHLFIGRAIDESERIVVAWGSNRIVRRTDRDAAVLDTVRNAGKRSFALRVNHDGSPGHPLYVAKTTIPVLFGSV